MTVADLTSPDMIQAFNTAAGLARDGELERSLHAWNELLEPSQPRTGPTPVLSGEFLGVAQMRRAWVLMDLERYERARECLEADLMQACLGQFPLATLYEYFFSYANTLGQLGEIDAMDDAMSRALGIAAEELGDANRCEQCWRWLVRHAQTAGAWEYLAREMPSLIAFASNAGLRRLEQLGRNTLEEALQRSR